MTDTERKEVLKKIDQLLAECEKGNHQFKEVYEGAERYGARNVVRWCEVCGSIVVDVDVDGRRHPGRAMGMQRCLIKRLLLELNKK